jgi:hypothetical protein
MDSAPNFIITTYKLVSVSCNYNQMPKICNKNYSTQNI